MKRLIEQTACEKHNRFEAHGSHDGKLLDLFCPGGSSGETREPLDFDAIWDRYYKASNRRFEPGLTYNELWFVVYGEKKKEEE